MPRQPRAVLPALAVALAFGCDARPPAETALEAAAPAEYAAWRAAVDAREAAERTGGDATRRGLLRRRAADAALADAEADRDAADREGEAAVERAGRTWQSARGFWDRLRTDVAESEVVREAKAAWEAAGSRVEQAEEAIEVARRRGNRSAAYLAAEDALRRARNARREAYEAYQAASVRAEREARPAYEKASRDAERAYYAAADAARNAVAAADAEIRRTEAARRTVYQTATPQVRAAEAAAEAEAEAREWLILNAPNAWDSYLAAVDAADAVAAERRGLAVRLFSRTPLGGIVGFAILSGLGALWRWRAQRKALELAERLGRD